MNSTSPEPTLAVMRSPPAHSASRTFTISMPERTSSCPVECSLAERSSGVLRASALRSVRPAGELEGSPEEGMRELLARGELGAAQRLELVSILKLVVEAGHEGRGSTVVDLPQARHDGRSSGVEESPGQSDHVVAARDLAEAGLAGR